MVCRTHLPCSAFDAECLNMWKRNRDVTRKSTCKACSADEENALLQCVVCRTHLPCSAFDADRLNMWKINRDVGRKATCKACSAKRPERVRNSQKETWKQSVYKCSVCESELPAHKFDTSVLKVLEETCTLYFAKCGSCDSDMKTKTAEMTCNLCRLTKPASSFSPARQRARNYATRRCKACDFPPCCSCGTIPTQPKQKPYMCPVCLFPPCACGAPRPPWSQNCVPVKPTWQCQACRE